LKPVVIDARERNELAPDTYDIATAEGIEALCSIPLVNGGNRLELLRSAVTLVRLTTRRKEIENQNGEQSRNKTWRTPPKTGYHDVGKGKTNQLLTNADESLKTKARGGRSSFLTEFADEYLNPFRTRKRHIVRCHNGNWTKRKT
jgi:hypothetical protein